MLVRWTTSEGSGRRLSQIDTRQIREELSFFVADHNLICMTGRSKSRIRGGGFVMSVKGERDENWRMTGMEEMQYIGKVLVERKMPWHSRCLNLRASSQMPARPFAPLWNKWDPLQIHQNREILEQYNPLVINYVNVLSVLLRVPRPLRELVMRVSDAIINNRGNASANRWLLKEEPGLSRIVSSQLMVSVFQAQTWEKSLPHRDKLSIRVMQFCFESLARSAPFR